MSVCIGLYSSKLRYQYQPESGWSVLVLAETKQGNGGSAMPCIDASEASGCHVSMDRPTFSALDIGGYEHQIYSTFV